MSYEDSIAAAGPAAAIDLIVVIDGIPVAFGSKPGIAFDTSSTFLGDPTSLTTVDGLVRESVSIGGADLDFDQLMTMPSGFSFRLRSSTSWDKYFQRRRTPQTRLTAAVDYTDSSLPVQSSSGWTAGDIAYIGSESIRVGGTASGALNSLTRQYAQTYNALPTSHGAGAMVHSSPIALKGRMAELWFHSNGEFWLERRGFLDSVSRDNARQEWIVSVSDLMSLLEKKIGFGYENLAIIDADRTILSADTPEQPIYAFNTLENLPSSTSAAAMESLYMRLDFGELYAIYKVVDVYTGYILTETNPVVSSRDDPVTAFNSAGNSGATATLFYRFVGSPVTAALRVLLSNLGDGANDATYDTLLGVTSNRSSGNLQEGEVDKCYGAGVSSALVDIDSFNAVSETSGEGWRYFLGAHGSVTLRDFLEEVAWATNAYLTVRNGKLTLKPIQGMVATDSTSFSVTEAALLADTSLECRDDEDEAVHTVTVKCNADPISGDLKGSITLRDARYYDAYKGSSVGSITLERHGLQVTASTPNNPVPATVASLIARLERVLHRRMRGLRKYSIKLPFRYHVYGPGDTVSVTTTALPDFAGSTLSSSVFEIISTGGIDLSTGTVEFTIADSWAIKSISPTGVVASWSGGPQTITLETNHRYGGDGTSPGSSLFGVGWKVRIMDKGASKPYFSTASGLLTVTAVGAATVTVSGTVGFTPAAGDLLVQAAYDDATSTTTVNGLDQRGHVFLADTNGLLGTADVGADLWG